MNEERNRHALPPSVVARSAHVGGGVSLPVKTLTMRPRTGVDVHFVGRREGEQRAAVVSGSSRDRASSPRSSLYNTTVEEIDFRSDVEDETEGHLGASQPADPSNCGMQSDVNIFRQNELWTKSDETGVAPGERKVSRLTSVSEAMEAVGRGAMRKMSWFRKDSAFPAGKTTQGVEDEQDEDDDVLISSGSERSDDESHESDETVADDGDGAPLSRNTESRLCRHEPIARPILPPVERVKYRVRRFGSSAYAAAIKTPREQRVLTDPDEQPLSPEYLAYLIKLAVDGANVLGRFTEGRRDRAFRRALGNNTTPAVQWKASIKLVIRAKGQKVCQDKNFAKNQCDHDFERLCGDVQKRSWRWRLARGRSQVRVQQVWHQMRTRSEPGREKSPVVLSGEGVVAAPTDAEATTIVGNVMRQQASTVGLALTP